MATSEFDRPDIDYRVTLRNSTNLGQFIVFEATPDLIETRNVNYKTIDPVHAPGQILAYATTSSRNFNLSQVKLISRTTLEAAQNLNALWLLRSWTMPRFGKSSLSGAQRQRRNAEDEANRDLDEWAAALGVTDEQSIELARQLRTERVADQFGDRGSERLGEPPAVLLFSAYSRDSQSPLPSVGTVGIKNASRGHINRVPVVIQNMSIPYPSDADYIPAAGTGIPMPTIMTIDMTLMETHSPREYEEFNLSRFKEGILAGY